jgi:opacity protein-like surface antigen
MKTLLQTVMTLSFVVLTTFAISAQDERNNWEIFGGYSYVSLDTGLDEIEADLNGFKSQFGLHGFEVSATGNFHRYVGVKGDFSYHVRTQTFTDGADSIQLKPRSNQFLGGLQFKDNAKTDNRFRPFAHVLAGIANQKVSVEGVFKGDPLVLRNSTNNFAMAFGGGIDYKLNDSVALRLIQFDYNPVWSKDTDVGNDLFIEGFTQNNYRFSFGVVLH